MRLVCAFLGVWPALFAGVMTIGRYALNGSLWIVTSVMAVTVLMGLLAVTTAV